MLPNKQIPSVMKHDFSSVPHANIPRSNFRRSHGYKTAFDSGYLIPIYVDEALPGDTFNVKLTSISRLATPLLPFMDNLFMDFFFFAVPNRLVWDNWVKMMGEQVDPGDSIDFTVPVVDSGGAGFALSELYDYFGIPTGFANAEVNNLHGRAYNLIWNEWFRDENLQDSVVVDKDNGPDAVADYVLLKRGKRHDYFTSCLPWPQKGDAIDLPLGTQAPIVGLGKQTQVYSAAPLNVYETDGTGTVTYNPFRLINGGGGNDDKFAVEEGNTGYPGKYADLSSATAATINSLREAFQLQRMLERDARSGTRYQEVILSHFRVVSPDARLQRPEYLGGGSSPVQITPIPQTESSDASTPQGKLTAVGYHSQSGVGFTKSFTEHSVIIGLVNVRADLTWQQGINRMWSRQTRYDYYWPALAHLGEQEVLNKEIWHDNSANDDLIFGYQERWAEYRYYPSKITGILRSDAAGSLDAWHLSVDYATLPVLNASFIEDSPPVARVVAVPAEPEFIFDGYFDIMCTRPIPTRSVPGLIDHF